METRDFLTPLFCWTRYAGIDDNCVCFCEFRICGKLIGFILTSKYMYVSDTEAVNIAMQSM